MYTTLAVLATYRDLGFDRAVNGDNFLLGESVSLIG